MHIAILGTGVVGRTLAAGLAALGHQVVVGTRDVEETAFRKVDDQTFAGWLEGHPGVRLLRFADAAAEAELVVNATAGRHSIEALQAAGPRHLAGKVLLDVANPLYFQGGLPHVDPVDVDSLGEQIQRVFVEARVVKALNTMPAALMVQPSLAAGGDHTTFVSGEDPEAKRIVAGLLRQLGHQDVLDLGGIDSARGPEMYLGLWIRVFQGLGTPYFNVKIVR